MKRSVNVALRDTLLYCNGFTPLQYKVARHEVKKNNSSTNLLTRMHRTCSDAIKKVCHEVKKKKLFLKVPFILIITAFAFLFLSCEEPDDPIVPYSYSMPSSLGKTINSIDIFWDEAPLTNFQSYDVFYREFYVAEPKHYVTIVNKKELYTTIVGLISDTEYRISIVTTDKNGNKYTSNELTEKTYSDIPSPIYLFRIDFESASSIRFIWTPYVDSYAVPFSRYEIYMDRVDNFVCSDSNRVVTVYNSLSSQANFNISNLMFEQDYYFKLRTYNTLGKYREFGTILFSRNNP